MEEYGGLLRIMIGLMHEYDGLMLYVHTSLYSIWVTSGSIRAPWIIDFWHLNNSCFIVRSHLATLHGLSSPLTSGSLFLASEPYDPFLRGPEQQRIPAVPDQRCAAAGVPGQCTGAGYTHGYTATSRIPKDHLWPTVSRTARMS